MNPFGGTRPPSSAEEKFFLALSKFFLSRIAMKARGAKANLSASMRPAMGKPPLDILTVHPILMERLKAARELLPWAKLGRAEARS